MFDPLQCSMEGKPDSNAIREGVGDLGDVGAELVVCLDVFSAQPKIRQAETCKTYLTPVDGCSDRAPVALNCRLGFVRYTFHEVRGRGSHA
jgi:hypothetical protein